jgi:hypothetical protein
MSIFSSSPSEFFNNLYVMLTPEPLSPLFKQGGIFHGINEDFGFMVLIMIFLFFCDNLIAKRYILPKGRYFFLHAIANGIVVFASIPDLIRALTYHPYDTLNHPAWSVVGNSATMGLHLYHILAFTLTSEDWWHHLQFIPMCFATPMFKRNIGCAVALSNFFLSGLPGGLEYVFLVLVMHGKMQKKTEKSYFAWLNQWVRGPGAVWTMILGYFSWRENLLPLHGAVAWTFGLFHLYNGMYFNQIAIESNARFDFNNKMAKTLHEVEKSEARQSSPTLRPTKVLPDY